MKQTSSNHLSLLQKAVALHKTGNIKQATVLYRKILKLNPNESIVLSNLATIALHQGEYENALTLFNQSLAINPNQPVAHNNRGGALKALNRLDEALECYHLAIKLKPDYAEAYNNQGILVNEFGQFSDAIDSFNFAISLKPNYANAYNNRGVSFLSLLKFNEALENFDLAISFNQNHAEAYNNKGIALQELRLFDDSILFLNKAIELVNDYADAYKNRAVSYQLNKQLDKAIVDFERLLELRPNSSYLLGNIFLSKLHICDWQRYEAFQKNILENTLKNVEVSPPFPMLAFTDSVKIQQKSAEIYARENYPKNMLPALNQYPAHSKIRVGYFSADFHDHATMHLIAELFEWHNKNQFEIHAFSFGANQKSEWRQRVEQAFDKFHDVRFNTDIEITQLARSLEIDIAVDLKGFTTYARPNIFARRAAPIQINYLGYPGTMGAEYMDYIIADHQLIPNQYKQYYTEKIIYLPNSYQVNVSKREVADKEFSREEIGLANNAFVFCCFNSNYKITPKIFSIWMNVLKNVDGSVLWLFKNSELEVNHLKQAAIAHGIDASRLVFSGFISIKEHLKRIQQADLFLDTFPVNAHTTASDALRVGLPIITLVGESFASRVAASLLNALNLPDLITSSEQEYELLAIKLAKNPQQLKAIKSKLINSVKESTLFNSQIFAKHIEAAFQAVYQRYQNNLLPEHIEIK